MTSMQDIASKLAYIKGQLTAGGTNAQMKEWYTEYKTLNKELEEAKAAKSKASQPSQTSTKPEEGAGPKSA
ncbi:hypothetical protein JDV02_002790 [Purpureocillium takamizusanense]|uniref:Uncharacterized protein n=1 Tax=Purpureocillium takamizusanense TaxID=2060973 RepID=A0A9Q8V844_9HYPO|nr:uncharacterized protein JDV02_002790 [Purpureocillium takamizusanense]UNI16353.1 hypothetical protein JDV02_002790 [Purpureocillium takamizusanense]